MFETIKTYINNMKNEDIKNIVNLMVEKNKEKLMYYPAAKKNHHYKKQTLSYNYNVKYGEKICSIYDFLNTDLIYGGIA